MVEIALALVSYARWVSIIETSSSTTLTLEPSSAPCTSVPTPPCPGAPLEGAVAEYEAQIDGYLDQDEDLAGYVRRLELMGDDDEDEEDEDETAVDEGSLDPGADAEQMVEDIERFLRDQGS